MATALANVSDDWVQRAFAAELGGKRVGGGVMEHLQGNAVVKLIMIWLLVNTINIISVTATKKFNGNTPKKTKALGGWMLFTASVEIALFAFIYAMLVFRIGELSQDERAVKLIMVIITLILASVSCGLHVAILLYEKRLNKRADQFFNAMRILFFLGIVMCYIMTFPEFEGKQVGVAAVLGCAALFILLASVLKNKGALIFFAFVASLLVFCAVIGVFTYWTS